MPKCEILSPHVKVMPDGHGEMHYHVPKELYNVVIRLNDGYEGGGVNVGGNVYKKDVGDAFIFQTGMYSVEPVEDEDRYVMSVLLVPILGFTKTGE